MEDALLELMAPGQEKGLVHLHIAGKDKAIQQVLRCSERGEKVRGQK